jgi:hypothetical protein
MNIKIRLLTLALVVALTGCVSTEPPRDVDTVSSSNTKTLTVPKIIESDANGLEIRYAELSMGFDATCNPFKSFSDEKNQCSQLPENVKVMAIDHCEKFAKKAVFLGNTTNFIQMTISNFSCEEQDT